MPTARTGACWPSAPTRGARSSRTSSSTSRVPGPLPARRPDLRAAVRDGGDGLVRPRAAGRPAGTSRRQRRETPGPASGEPRLRQAPGAAIATAEPGGHGTERGGARLPHPSRLLPLAGPTGRDPERPRLDQQGAPGGAAPEPRKGLAAPNHGMDWSVSYARLRVLTGQVATARLTIRMHIPEEDIEGWTAERLEETARNIEFLAAARPPARPGPRRETRRARPPTR